MATRNDNLGVEDLDLSLSSVTIGVREFLSLSLFFSGLRLGLGLTYGVRGFVDLEIWKKSQGTCDGVVNRESCDVWHVI